MQLEIYQQETEKLVIKNQTILNEISQKISLDAELSLIEEHAMLHSIQVIIKNAIGKARHILKLYNSKVPVSAYDLFAGLHSLKVISLDELQQWKKVVGLRNAIVHEYMKVDLELLKKVVLNQQYEFVLLFLNAPFEKFYSK
ncbi:MAG: DUF86 domain-containing protein [Gammaproteobacteria bacterium]|nr:DUF86 domain-containing protein [Gammaproteobacteria bacterium]